MKIRVYCEKCEKEYLLEVGQPWVGLMTCPHDVDYHILREVLEDETDKDDANTRRD